MKVCELFRKVDFVRIIPALVKDDKNSKEFLDAYREAFDILRSMVPNPTEAVITLERTLLDGINPSISVKNCEGDTWENNLGKEIFIGKGINCSDEELTARILKSLTFFGYNLKEKEEFVKNLQLCHFLSGNSVIFAEDNKG